jgi:hypothetical protein
MDTAQVSDLDQPNPAPDGHADAPREAVNAIATCAADQSALAHGGARQADMVLTKAVLALASMRASPGPLGSLAKQSAKQFVTVEVSAKPVTDAPIE